MTANSPTARRMVSMGMSVSLTTGAQVRFTAATNPTTVQRAQFAGYSIGRNPIGFAAFIGTSATWCVGRAATLAELTKAPMCALLLGHVAAAWRTGGYPVVAHHSHSTPHMDHDCAARRGLMCSVVARRRWIMISRTVTLRLDSRARGTRRRGKWRASRLAANASANGSGNPVAVFILIHGSHRPYSAHAFLSITL